MDTDRDFLYKIRALFLIFKTSRNSLPSPPNSAPVSAAEYASIPSICLNILENA